MKNRVYLLNTLYLFHIFIYAFFPQQFLYFLPLPHVQVWHVLLLFIIFMLLLVFIDFKGQYKFNTYTIFGTYGIIVIYHRMTKG